jgi:hypothetical protein
VKRTVVAAAILGLGVAGMSAGTAAPSVTKITGGGQTLVPAEGGAGDTVGFNAQVDEAGNVKGQFQYVDRTGGTGKDQTVAHGDVTCAAVFSRPDDGGSGGVAVFGGTLRDGTSFRVDVTDNGSGGDATDLILVRTGDEAEGDNAGLCDEDDQEDGADLSRGNVTIHKA